MRDVPVCFDNMTTTTEFLEAEGVNSLIGSSELERLLMGLDFGGQFAEIKIRERMLELLFNGENSADEDFEKI